MKIKDVNIYPFKAERVYKTVTASLGGIPNYDKGVSYSDFAILELISEDGISGYGEISDIPDSLKMPGGRNLVLKDLESLLFDILHDRDPFDIDVIMSTFPVKGLTDERIDGTVYDIVACGVDNALYDLIGKTLNLPVYNFIGGKKEDEIKVSWVVFIRSLEDMESEIVKKVEEGFDAFKLKVGIDIKLDEERLRLVRQIAGDDANIKIDANSGWTIDEAEYNLKRLEKYNPSGIETPIHYLDIEGKAKLREKTCIPIIEHVHTPDFALKLIKANAIDVFNVSTTGCGGIMKAKKVLAVALAGGIPYLLGSTVEAGLGTAAQLHLAASGFQISWPSDLVGPKLYLNDNIEAPLSWRKNMLKVPDGPGLGVKVDISKWNYLSE